MLGDTGANVIGATLGLGVVLGLGSAARTSVLIALIVLNVLAEVLSFSRVIDRVGFLRAFDRLGQRPERRNA
jgi:UDP-N-acetylmuramyl pentapeptide phosphotransferase/UDP-N-acetylglucosamine-1-phosphate transferase